MKPLPLLLLCLLGATVLPLHADELTRSAQQSLKDLGFYYGEITGTSDPETVAAMKRFQIRNGYEPTGTLTKETLESLGLEEAAPEPGPVQPPAPATPAPVPPKTTTESANGDRAFLKQPTPAQVMPPAPPAPQTSPGSAPYAAIFAATPYASAPNDLQASIVRKAQTFLNQNGYLPATAVTGQPGRSTEDALLAYQRRVNLPLSGRLDLSTLRAMQLLPGDRNGPALKPFNGGPRPAPGTRIYRGVWIH